MDQAPIEVLYELRCESPASIFDLHAIVTYLATRVGKMDRIRFQTAMSITVWLDAKQRRNFLRYLKANWLNNYLVSDDKYKDKRPRWRTAGTKL